MKRTLFASAVAVAMLWITVSFAQNPLTEQFTTLSEQIIQQAERPFDKLEELKTLFTSCAEKHSSPEVKAACAEWLASSYPKIKEATPQQIYVELWSGDVEVKFIKSENEPAYWAGENIDIYQVDIPKYNFSYQFYLVKATAKKPLSERKRSQHGNIVIPDPQYWHTEASTIFPSEVIAVYATPQLSGDSSLQEVGREYKKVYQDAFQFTDWGNYYQGYRKGLDTLPTSKKFASFPKTIQNILNERFSYLMYDGDLPKFLNKDTKFSPFTWDISLLYGRHKAGTLQYCEPQGEDIASAWKPKWWCKQLLKEKYNNKYPLRLYVVWNKNTPQYIWAVSDNRVDLPGGQFIVK